MFSSCNAPAIGTMTRMRASSTGIGTTTARMTIPTMGSALPTLLLFLRFRKGNTGNKGSESSCLLGEICKSHRSGNLCERPVRLS